MADTLRDDGHSEASISHFIEQEKAALAEAGRTPDNGQFILDPDNVPAKDLFARCRDISHDANGAISIIHRPTLMSLIEWETAELQERKRLFDQVLLIEDGALGVLRK